MNDDTLRQLTNARMLERLHEAQRERLALQLRDARARHSTRRAYAPLLGHLLTIRRHATH